MYMKIFSLAAMLLSYYIYKAYNRVPPIPEIDLNEYWGFKGKENHQDTSIRSFEVQFSDVIVNDLKERLMHRRSFTPPLDGAGFTYGFNSVFLERILDFWKNSYDFKEREAYMNKFAHFKTNIQGLDMHYVHVKPSVSKNVKVLPLLMLHGWPGSVREFYELISALTKQQDNIVFEVITPSLPGFGYSQGSSRPSLGITQAAVIIRNLMQRIGHKTYYIHGGDFGARIATDMAILFPDEVLGFHSNFLLNYSGTSLLAWFIGSLAPNLWLEIEEVERMYPLSERLSRWIEETGYVHMQATKPDTVGFHSNFLLNYSGTSLLAWFIGSLAPNLWLEIEEVERMYPLSERLSRWIEETGYVHMQATKPDTVGIGLTNDPAGLAAYILEKFSSWNNPAWREAMDGNLLKKFHMTDLLDNVMIYWTSGCITTSMRLYAESLSSKNRALQMDLIPTHVPAWGIKFKYELLYQPDSIIRLKYTNLLQTTMVDDGGHFGAMENPTIMAVDIFKAVRAFVEFNSIRNN